MSSNCLRYSFLYLKIAKIHFHGVLLSSILICKIPEFWRCKLGDQNFVSFDSGNIHIKDSKKEQFLLFLSSGEPNSFNVMVYFCSFQNAILHRVAAKVLKFSVYFATFFLYFWLSVWVEIYILNFLMGF